MIRINRFIAPLAAKRTAIVESIALPLLTIGIGMWVNPPDPLWVNGSFPWPWLAPLILALRYGPFAGLGGAVLLLVAWLTLSPLSLQHAPFPELYFLGGLIVTMICSEFSSIWRARLRRAEAMQLYLDQRLEYLTYQHYLLRLSHDRLEQDLIVRPVAMRDALMALRHLSIEASERHLPGGTEMLRLLAQYCQIESAALYGVSDGVVDVDAVSQIGAPFTLEKNDPLVRFAITENHLSHIQSIDENVANVNYLVAAPLTTRLGKLRGLLVIKQMPFFALHEETLQTLNLLLGYYADSLDAGAVARPILAMEPECPHAFAFELARVWRIREESGVRSTVVALVFSSERGQEDLPRQILRQSRSLDITWLVERSSHTVLITLMPLSSLSGAEGYLARLDAWAKQQRNKKLADCGVANHIYAVDEVEPIALLERLRIACGISTETWSVGARV